jgi:hypothetical protein
VHWAAVGWVSDDARGWESIQSNKTQHREATYTHVCHLCNSVPSTGSVIVTVTCFVSWSMFGISACHPGGPTNPGCPLDNRIPCKRLNGWCGKPTLSPSGNIPWGARESCPRQPRLCTTQRDLADGSVSPKTSGPDILLGRPTGESSRNGRSCNRRMYLPLELRTMIQFV